MLLELQTENKKHHMDCYEKNELNSILARPSTLGMYQAFTYKKQRYNNYTYVNQAMAF